MYFKVFGGSGAWFAVLGIEPETVLNCFLSLALYFFFLDSLAKLLRLASKSRSSCFSFLVGGSISVCPCVWLLRIFCFWENSIDEVMLFNAVKIWLMSLGVSVSFRDSFILKFMSERVVDQWQSHIFAPSHLCYLAAVLFYSSFLLFVSLKFFSSFHRASAWTSFYPVSV